MASPEGSQGMQRLHRRVMESQLKEKEVVEGGGERGEGGGQRGGRGEVGEERIERERRKEGGGGRR